MKEREGDRYVHLAQHLEDWILRFEGGRIAACRMELLRLEGKYNFLDNESLSEGLLVP